MTAGPMRISSFAVMGLAWLAVAWASTGSPRSSILEAETTTAAPTTTTSAPSDGDRTAEAILELPLGEPLPTVSRSFDIEVADFNGDGHDDVVLTRHQNKKIAADDPDGIWIWDPTGYELMLPFPMMRDRHGCAAGDVNGDHLMDVYCQLGGALGSGRLKANELWIQVAPGEFEDQAAVWGVEDPTGRGRWPVMFDYDGDGLLDLYVTNKRARLPEFPSANRLFHNVGGRFEEAANGATGKVGFLCLNAVDFNFDGWTDLTFCDGKGTLVFLQNENGTDFIDVTEAMSAGSRGWSDAAFADLNGDGMVDLALVGADRAQVRINQGPAKWFTKVTHEAPLGDLGWRLAIGDFHGDENPDIYVVQQGVGCTDTTTSKANGADILLVGPSWTYQRLWNHTLGCGDEAQPLDNNLVIVTNGHSKTRGPVEILNLRSG